jgi:hypothetical protein
MEDYKFFYNQAARIRVKEETSNNEVDVQVKACFIILKKLLSYQLHAFSSTGKFGAPRVICSYAGYIPVPRAAQTAALSYECFRN